MLSSQCFVFYFWINVLMYKTAQKSGSIFITLKIFLFDTHQSLKHWTMTMIKLLKLNPGLEWFLWKWAIFAHPVILSETIFEMTSYALSLPNSTFLPVWKSLLVQASFKVSFIFLLWKTLAYGTISLQFKAITLTEGNETIQSCNFVWYLLTMWIDDDCNQGFLFTSNKLIMNKIYRDAMHDLLVYKTVTFTNKRMFCYTIHLGADWAIFHELYRYLLGAEGMEQATSDKGSRAPVLICLFDINNLKVSKQDLR